MRTAAVILVIASALGQVAGAQPATDTKPVSGLPLESVIVSASKPTQPVIQHFVETRTGRTMVLGRAARWILKLCPKTIGLGDKYASYVTRRIRDIGAAVGAPVDSDPGCRPNIEVVFTTKPQALIDNIRKTDPVYLGFHQTKGEGDELARVVQPIQAWYTTTVQMNYEHRPIGFGGGTLDVGKCPVTGAVSVKAAGNHVISMPCSAAGTATKSGGQPGARAIKDGQNSGFFNILIVAEPAKLYDYEVGSLADYIALMALTQPAALDDCEEMPSISNLLAKGCGASAGNITDGDLAYLRALYRLPGGEFMVAQREFIKRQMTQALAGKGGAN